VGLLGLILGKIDTIALGNYSFFDQRSQRVHGLKSIHPQGRLNFRQACALNLADVGVDVCFNLGSITL